MVIELSGKEFPLVADLLSVARAERENNVRLSDLEEGGLEALGVVLFHFARRGAEKADKKWPYKLDEFLGFVHLSDLPKITETVASLMGGPEEGEKKT